MLTRFLDALSLFIYARHAAILAKSLDPAEVKRYLAV